MVMKRFFVMLSLLILGKESMKSVNVDVYLEPLMDELLVLWDGVPIVDMSDNPHAKKFILQGMLLWTIHDYPTYGLISGCATKGYQGCPICGLQVDSRFSKSLKKKSSKANVAIYQKITLSDVWKSLSTGNRSIIRKPPRMIGFKHRRRGEAQQR